MKSDSVTCAMGRWSSALALALFAPCGGGDDGSGGGAEPPAGASGSSGPTGAAGATSVSTNFVATLIGASDGGGAGGY